MHYLQPSRNQGTPPSASPARAQLTQQEPARGESDMKHSQPRIFSAGKERSTRRAHLHQTPCTSETTSRDRKKRRPVSTPASSHATSLDRVGREDKTRQPYVKPAVSHQLIPPQRIPPRISNHRLGRTRETCRREMSLACFENVAGPTRRRCTFFDRLQGRCQETVKRADSNARG